MPPFLGRRTAPAAGLITLGLVLGALGIPTASADDTTSLPAPAVESTDAATEALTEVQEIVDGEGAGRDLTMALRDLRLHQDELSRVDRATARKVLSRPLPDSSPFADFGPIRVHWAKGDTSITTDWINLVGTTSQQVLATYAAAGYRMPKSDGTAGGSAHVDIYVVNQDPGLYGYCDTDASPPNGGPYDVPAYCSFDNDYAGFPGTPADTLRVTAAHELFHAVQFAYDYEEDRWFLEATATWAEDELFDDVNDNWQYLSSSPLRQPRESLDQFSRNSLRQYGEWIFFRYLTERWKKSQGGMPVIMRRLFERVDGAKGGPDLYSMRAIERELASKGTSITKVYGDFSDANRRPRATYEEGAAYPVAAPSATWRLSKRRPDTRLRETRLNHLSSTTARLVPGAQVRGRSWRVRIAVDLPVRATAVVSTYRTNGAVKTKHVRLDKRGNGRLMARFDGRTIAYVEVTLVNASTRYRCWRANPDDRVFFSCRGKPRDQRQKMLIRARAIR